MEQVAQCIPPGCWSEQALPQLDTGKSSILCCFFVARVPELSTSSSRIDVPSSAGVNIRCCCATAVYLNKRVVKLFQGTEQQIFNLSPKRMYSEDPCQIA